MAEKTVLGVFLDLIAGVSVSLSMVVQCYGLTHPNQRCVCIACARSEGDRGGRALAARAHKSQAASALGARRPYYTTFAPLFLACPKLS